jgi:predicted dehydrogenase
VKKKINVGLIGVGRMGWVYIDQLQNFIEHLSAGLQPSITCADGVADLDVAYAATLSYKEKRPISLTKS